MDSFFPKTGSSFTMGDQFEFHIASLQGNGRRESQEDCFGYIDNKGKRPSVSSCFFGIVADGIGGLEDGEKASYAAVECIISGLLGAEDEDCLPEIINSLLYEANEKVFSIMHGFGGCTAIPFCVSHDKLFYASVGDSYIYLFRNNVLTRLNVSQNVHNEKLMETIEFGTTYENNEGERVDALTNYIGKEKLESFEYLRYPLRLKYGDVLLVCSDGIPNTLEESEIIRCLSYHKPEKMCTVLRKKVEFKKNAYQDNYTALIVQCISKHRRIKSFFQK